ncbi:right-handed parallel beta-helix repeat-containing protein [Sphaerisporangium sp. NPDC051011]|uniref:right-handed parallel beta-helix repeat-containing protein n=1 Tax=Sphaerisporangium sp. NPDC051011 TaxID=3155792 RepID=UPI0033E39618
MRLSATRIARPGVADAAAAQFTGPAAALRLRPSAGVMGGFPSAATTGYTAWPGYTGSLATYTGPMPIPASDTGTTFQGLRFTGATIGVPGAAPSDVTFRGCLFQTTAPNDWNVQDYGLRTTFEYCTFRPAATSTPPVSLAQSYQYGINHVGLSLTVRRCEFWGFGNGIQLGTSTQTNPVLVEDSYFHDAADQAGSTYHHDGILSNNGGSQMQYVTIRRNTIISGGNTNGIALQYDGAYYSNVTVVGNLLGGWGYAVNIGGNAAGNSNVVFTDNVLTTQIQPVHGELYGWKDGSGNTWRRNKWLVPAGAAYGNPADSGKYWWPDGTRNATDYTG